MKTHAAAVLNAAEYDRRKGGQTMPGDVVAVLPPYKRLRKGWKTYKPMNDKKKDRK